MGLYFTKGKDTYPMLQLFLNAVEPRLSGSRLSGLFLWSQFGHEYLLVMIKIRSRILFKTTELYACARRN